MSKSYYVLLVLALGTLQLAGCIGRGSGSGSLAFSPDGKQVCYLKEDRIEEKVVDGKVWSRSISLRWCSTTNSAMESWAHIDTLGAEFRSYVMFLSKAKWSPSGSWIGVLTPIGLTIVEVQSGRKHGIRDGTIVRFAWLPNGQIAYCTRRINKNMRSQIVICREDVGTRQRREVYAFSERPKEEGGFASVSWSPSGKYVVVLTPDPGGQFHCVDVSDGTVQAFGQADAYDVGVSWAQDSRRVFCVSNKVGPDERYEAVLLNPETRILTNCTAGFQKTFEGHAPDLDPLWTVDGKYVLANALHINGYLVQPDPWKAIPLGQMLAPGFSVPKPSTINPRLFRLPVAGWVGVVPTGNEGDSPVKYLADYSGQRTVPMTEDYPRDISPDGTLAATIGGDGHVKIHRLGKWWQPPAKNAAK